MSRAESSHAHVYVVQRQETTGLEPVQCGFESLHRHHAPVSDEASNFENRNWINAGSSPVWGAMKNVRSAKPAKVTLTDTDGNKQEVIRRPLVERYVIDEDSLSTL